MTNWTPNYPFCTSVWDLSFSEHARRKMKERHIHPYDVMLVMSNGEWQFGSDRAICYAFDKRRTNARKMKMARHAGIDNVVVVMARRTCQIITVYRQWGYDGWRQMYRRPLRPQSTWHQGRGN